MDLLKKKHKEHIFVYGENNDLRLSGRFETSSIEKFSYGEGNRAASVRIPAATIEKHKGHFEDRRPASNLDPYVVTGMIIDSIILDSKYCSSLL
jgi:glutamine synthetase